MTIAGGVIDGRQMLEMSLGDHLVWPTTKPEVVITLGATSAEQHQARDQLRDAIYATGRHYSTVKTLPFTVVLEGTGYATRLFDGCNSLTSIPPMDTSGVTSMQGMFRNCQSLTTVPDMDTSGVTSMYDMFLGCFNLTTAPAMNTSNVTTMRGMFQYCNNLTSVPDMDTSGVTSMVTMFFNCPALYDGSVRLLRDTMPPSSATTNMIGGSGLTRLPFYTFDGTPLD